MIRTNDPARQLQADEAGTARGADVFRSSFWISPQGQLADLGGGAHISAIAAHPAKFGLTRDDVDKEYQKHGEPIGMEGKTREAHERETFYPHIFIERELSRPTSIVTLIATGVARWKKIRLPEGIAQES